MSLAYDEDIDETETRKPHPYDVIIGRNLRLMRVQTRLTQAELSSRMGYTLQQLQKQETAANRISAGALVRLAQAMGCEPSELLRGIGDSQPAPNHAEDFSSAELRLLMDFRSLGRHADRLAISQLIRSLARSDDE